MSAPAEIVAVEGVTDEAAIIRFRRGDGVEGQAPVSADRWPVDYWPPAVGDLIEVIPRHVVLTARRRPT